MDNSLIQNLVLMGGLAVSTLISEDLTCVGAGVLITQGRIGFFSGAFACFLGIYVGDMLLFLAGKTLGRSALKSAPLKWLIGEEDVEKSSDWFSKKGILVIGASRFLPGARLPTYFAAGLLKARFSNFAFYLFLAGAIWTPVLVGFSVLLGPQAIRATLISGQHVILRLVTAGALLYISTKIILSLTSYKGRRLLVSSWRRLTRWEYWPPYIFYIPVTLYLIALGIKHRNFSLFTAANPAIPGGGFIGESKSEILGGLSKSKEFVAITGTIAGSLTVVEKFNWAKEFMASNSLSYPAVLKPDVGQRGSGVAIVRSEEELGHYLSHATGDTIVQEYISGLEFGVFYYRYPSSDRGRILSVTEKRFPFVVGDGTSTLERLILEDKRAICMARSFLGKLATRLEEVPHTGKQIQLVEVGTHCRGATFADGGWVETTALEETIDQISQGFEGFYFGRYDIRTPSINDFLEGKNFKIIELNGVTSEATHIYDDGNGLFAAYKVLFRQWQIAFEIGAWNRDHGVRPTSLRGLAKMVLDYLKTAQIPA